MVNRQTMWVDVIRCTGCGACADVCPVGAIALMDGKAHVDEELCTGCNTCVGTCPEGAIQPVLQGEIVAVPERPAPTVRWSSPLVETAGAAVVATGVGLLTRAAGALGRWLTRQSAAPSLPAAGRTLTTGGNGAAGRGRRARHRRGRG
jgi:NAD-dependent dihydropyrimidine dehydrogenase PreA subunit